MKNFIKLSFLVLLFSIHLSVLGQELPCQFSWDNVRTYGGPNDFVTQPKDQGFQGPCFTYAISAVAETMYGIENSTTVNRLQNLSSDYLYWGDPSTNSLKEFGDRISNHKFKIPHQPTSNTRSEYFGKLVNTSSPGVVDYLRDDRAKFFFQNTRACIEQGKDFLLSATTIEIPYTNGLDITIQPGDHYFGEDITCGNDITKYDYYSIGNLQVLSRAEIANVEDVKSELINHGPVVMSVNATVGLDRFAFYTTPELFGVSSHAYALIGWKDTPDGTQWIIKDSWPGKSGIKETSTSKLSDAYFIEQIQNNKIQLATISDVKKNNKGSGSRYRVESSIQCPPLRLSQITFNPEIVSIGNLKFSKISVSSTNHDVSDWQWDFDFCRTTRNLEKKAKRSSILFSPCYRVTNGLIRVRGKRNGVWSRWQRTHINSNSGEITGTGPY